MLEEQLSLASRSWRQIIIYEMGWGQQLLPSLLSAWVIRRHFWQIINDFLSSFRAAMEYCLTMNITTFFFFPPSPPPLYQGLYELHSLPLSAHIARQEASLQLPDCFFTSEASREWEAQQRPHSCHLFALQPGCLALFTLLEVLAACSKTSSCAWACKAPEEKTKVYCAQKRSLSLPRWCRLLLASLCSRIWKPVPATPGYSCTAIQLCVWVDLRMKASVPAKSWEWEIPKVLIWEKRSRCRPVTKGHHWDNPHCIAPSQTFSHWFSYAFHFIVGECFVPAPTETSNAPRCPFHGIGLINIKQWLSVLTHQPV